MVCLDLLGLQLSMEAEKCTFLDLTRTILDLSPLAEGPSSLAECHSPLAEK